VYYDNDDDDDDDDDDEIFVLKVLVFNYINYHYHIR